MPDEVGKNQEARDDTDVVPAGKKEGGGRKRDDQSTRARREASRATLTYKRKPPNETMIQKRMTRMLDMLRRESCSSRWTFEDNQEEKRSRRARRTSAMVGRTDRAGPKRKVDRATRMDRRAGRDDDRDERRTTACVCLGGTETQARTEFESSPSRQSPASRP